jgi:hypothetical protein
VETQGKKKKKARQCMLCPSKIYNSSITESKDMEMVEMPKCSEIQFLK